MESNAALAEELAEAWRFFYRRGYIEDFGHIRARSWDPERILVSPNRLARKAGPEDSVTVDLDGRQIGTKVALPLELPIHIEVYRSRPDVGSVAHFHCLHATSFSTVQLPLRPSYFLASIFRDGIPLHPDSRLISNRKRGVALAATLGSPRAALLKAHGVVTTSMDVEEMVAATFILEDTAQRTWVSASLGEVEFLSDEAMAEILKSRGPFQRIWTLCESASDE